MPLFTFVHGTADRQRMLELLHTVKIRELVDVRNCNGEPAQPGRSTDEMACWLPEHGIKNRWERRLGGWRKPQPDSPDTGLRNRSFAGYAAHMRTQDFLEAVHLLLAEARDRATTGALLGIGVVALSSPDDRGFPSTQRPHASAPSHA